MSDETKTCTRCGEMKPLDGFYPRRRQCKTCVGATVRAYREKNADLVRERSRERRARTRGAETERALAWRHARQSTSLASAANRYKEWTGPELELVADLSRTVQDVAEALGRTFASVEHQRRKIRIDPRKARMAGTDVEKP